MGRQVRHGGSWRAPRPAPRAGHGAAWPGGTWMLFGDLVSRLSKGPYWASYGLLWGLIADTKWKSTDHPSTANAYIP